MCQIRGSRNAAGKSNTSAWASWGSARTTAPVSAGDVRTRIASIAPVMSCSGREIRSQYRETGLKQSLTETSSVSARSSCWRTGATRRETKMSPGRRRTGTRLTVATAAPVTMFVAPGPIELVQASARSRRLRFAYATAVWTIPCSLRACW